MFLWISSIALIGKWCIDIGILGIPASIVYCDLPYLALLFLVFYVWLMLYIQLLLFLKLFGTVYAFISERQFNVLRVGRNKVSE